MIRLTKLLLSGLIFLSAFLSVNAGNQLDFYGLPSSQSYRAIRCIVRDYKGFMWFGTESGLARFDGINQQLYVHNPENAHSLSYDIINVLSEDQNKCLWVGTSQGLNFYDRASDRFDKLPSSSIEKKLLNAAYVSAFSSEDDSLFWIGTYNQGLFCMNRFTSRVIRYKLVLRNGTIPSITCLLKGTGDLLWIGTQSGLIMLHPKTGKAVWHRRNATDEFSISSNNVSSLVRDVRGNVWVGTLDGGLNKVVKQNDRYLFERKNRATSKNWIASTSINKMMSDKAGNLWIGTDNDGLHLMNVRTGSTEVFTHEVGNKNSLGSNSVWSVYDDGEGRVWLGSYNKGISVFDPMYSKFENYQVNPYREGEAVSNDFRSFCFAQDGTIWAATDGGGICSFDPKSRTFGNLIYASKSPDGLTNNSVQTILCDKQNEIWAGTWGGGVDRFSTGRKRLKNYVLETRNGIGNGKLRTLFEDGFGNIWAGTNGSGLFLYNRKKDAFEPFVFNDYLNERSIVTALSFDKNNRLWVGTLSGLVCLKLNSENKALQVKHLTTKNSVLNTNAINSLYIDRKNAIWMGTNGGGVNVYFPESGTFKRFQKKNGLASDYISAIVEDTIGNIWISTNAGLTRMNTTSGVITTFNTEDGLNSSEFYSKSCLKTKQGDLIFGSNNGFTVVRPGKIPVNRLAPSVVLTGLKINNKPVEIGAQNSPLKRQLSELDTLRLTYRQSSFSIDFVGMNYTRPDQNEFEYKLEGYDDEWNRIGTQKSVYFTKVKPGKYTLKIRGANNDGVWSKDSTNLYLVVTPPFWQTTIAYLIYVILFFFIVRFILRAWNERIRIKNQLELETLAKQKEHELNVKNMDFFTHISHEFRTPLSLILAPVESLLKSAPAQLRGQLEVIRRNAQRLLTLTNDLLDLRKIEDGGMQLHMEVVDVKSLTETIVQFFSVQIQNQNIQLNVDYPDVETVCVLDSEKYHTVLFNLLSNAMKYTPAGGTIRISLSRDYSEKNWEVSVTNTGVGIQPSDLPFVFDKFFQAETKSLHKQQGSGIGLALVKSLVELQGGEIQVTSVPMQETTFTFTLPIKASSSDQVVDNLEPEPEEEAKEVNAERQLVLIVEDNEDLQEFLKNEMAVDYEVVVAKNGEEGCVIAAEVIPDLIISDVVMPKMNGYKMCGKIKSDVRTSHIPVIMLTAKSTTDDHIQGLEIGADAYLTKPFNLKLLKTQVANLIQTRKDLYTIFSNDLHSVMRKQSGNSLDQAFLQSTVDFILENMGNHELNIEMLAGFHNMSHRNYYRKIKAITGYTVVELVKLVRLKEALRLMGLKQYTLSEISYMTGFTSPSYFTKNFREFYGKTPSEYLK